MCFCFQRIIDIFDNLLEETNTEGWQELQTVSVHVLQALLLLLILKVLIRLPKLRSKSMTGK